MDFDPTDAPSALHAERERLKHEEEVKKAQKLYSAWWYAECYERLLEIEKERKL